MANGGFEKMRRWTVPRHLYWVENLLVLRICVLEIILKQILIKINYLICP